MNREILKHPLHSLVTSRFVSAKESGNLIFSATQLAVLRSKRGVEYQLRYCPALAKKPNADKPQQQQQPSGPKKPDPFENPPADLRITEIAQTDGGDVVVNDANNGDGDATHVLVLNKFPVIPNHFIIATKSYKEQTHLLEKDDLAVSFACLKAWSGRSSGDRDREEGQEKDGGNGKRLFAFFNSGAESGASQPHRHLQFLPIEDMRAQEVQQDGSGPESWTPLIDRFSPSSPSSSLSARLTQSGLRYLPELPFQHFAALISPESASESDRKSNNADPTADSLHNTYLSLYRAALLAAGYSDTDSEMTQTSSPSAISYNLAMTEDVMLLCPRRKESASLWTTSGSIDEETESDLAVSLNGTILAGTLMVKSEEQWDRLLGNADLVDSLLRDVGMPY